MSTVYTPDGLSYHASVTLPSDGDPAVVASVNAAGFQYLADNTAWLQLLLAKIYNVRNYGAVGDGSTNDLPAFQAALSDASGGGVLYIPKGYYVLNGGLNINPAVSLVGDPFSSILLLNHATADFLTFNSNTGTGRPATRISNLGFGAITPNTGRVLYNTGADVECLVDNCDINGINVYLNGTIWYNNNGASRWTFANNTMRVKGDVQGFVQGPATGTLSMFGNTIVMPSTYSSTLVYLALGAANISGNSFDCTAQSSGADPTCIGISSGASTPVNITGNRFFSTTGSGPTKFALSADSNTNVVMRGNSFRSVNRFAGIGSLSNGSHLDLIETNAASLSGNSYTLSDGIENQSVRFTGGTTGPSITLPAIYYPGQVIRIIVLNVSGATWTLGFGLSNYSYKAPIPTGMTDGLGATATFVASDLTNSGTYSWVQIGEWATII